MRGSGRPSGAAAASCPAYQSAASSGSAKPASEAGIAWIRSAGTPAVSDERAVFAVRDCPKPPPTRMSLGFSAIDAAEEVWLLVSGAAKAPAVARALTGGATPEELPAAGVHGRRATRWLLDAEAAGELAGQG